MPLYKRKPFPLLEKHDDIKPDELVYQVRFTKEIFKDYARYLNRINLYRQRVWTCKVSGKNNLTYEEALITENLASMKAQKFPTDLVPSVLPLIQFSMLTLKDLVKSIAVKFEEQLSEGSELSGRRNKRTYQCKIVKIIEDTKKTEYEVAWLDKDGKIKEHSVLGREDLIKKKPPFSRDTLKSFVRGCTYRSTPWVLHDDVAQKYGISTDPPEELKSKVFLKDGRIVNMKRKRSGVDQQDTTKVSEGELRLCKRRKPEMDDAEKENDGLAIKYPIEDLLVLPSANDPVLTERPPPSSDFNIPMDCVGNLLMIWDFCSSFARLLRLWPFSLEDFEKAICCRESTPELIVESYSALLCFLVKDEGEYAKIIQKKPRKSKITLITWTEFLCDFLEMIGIGELSTHVTTIKRGHYGLLDIQIKLRIFCELVHQALATDLVRGKLDKYIEEGQTLAATRRGEAIQEARKKREEKEKLKIKSDGEEVRENGHVEFVRNSNDELNGSESNDSGDVDEKLNGRASSQETHIQDSENMQVNSVLKKRKNKAEADALQGSSRDSSRKGSTMLGKDDKKEAGDKNNKEQRKEFFEREMEKRFIRRNPLGKDRDYNKYWFFHHDGKMFVESSDSTHWGYYSHKEELDALIGSLNQKGVRERALKRQMEKNYIKLCSGLQKNSKEVGCNISMEDAVLRRSTRVRASPRDNTTNTFLKYVNKWKE